MIVEINEVRKIVAQSDERKKNIALAMNNEILSKAQEGQLQCWFPPGLTDPEKEWLKDTLIIHGYTVTSNGFVQWK